MLWLTGRSTLTISDGPECTSPITGSNPSRTPNPMVGCLCTDTLNNSTPWQEGLLLYGTAFTWRHGENQAEIALPLSECVGSEGRLYRLRINVEWCGKSCCALPLKDNEEWTQICKNLLVLFCCDSLNVISAKKGTHITDFFFFK